MKTVLLLLFVTGSLWGGVASDLPFKEAISLASIGSILLLPTDRSMSIARHFYLKSLEI